MAVLKRVLKFAATASPNDVETARRFAVETAMAVNERDHRLGGELEKVAFLLDARGEKIRKPLG